MTLVRNSQNKAGIEQVSGLDLDLGMDLDLSLSLDLGIDNSCH